MPRSEAGCTLEYAVNSYKQSLYAAAIRITANVLMVAAVFLAMYRASQEPDTSETVFCLWFFGITVPLWLSAFYLTRFVRRRFPAEYQSLVQLPKVGSRLVSWRVLEAPCRSIMVR